MPSPSPDSLQGELRLVTALREALAGNSDQANALLRETDESSLGVPAIDLLARIAFARGDTEEARRLWQLALTRKSDFEPARTALATLDSPWRTKYMLRIGAIGAAGILLVILAGFGVRSVVSARATQPVAAPDAAAAASSTEVMSERAPWPGVQPAGFKVERDTGSLTLTPGNPLFTDRCEFAPTAGADLEAIARLMQNELRDCSVVIVGQTDSRIVRSDSTFRDNYNLGWQRAVSVADYLRQVHDVPVGRISASSAGVAPGEPGRAAPDTGAKGGRTVVFRFERLHESR